MGGGVHASSLKFLPGVGLGRGVKFLIYFLEGGGGPGDLETPLATPLTMGRIKEVLWVNYAFS